MNIQNFISQFFANLPTLTLTSIVLILALSKKFKVNALLMTSSILSIVGAVASLVFWATDRTSTEAASFLLMTNFLFSSVSAMFLYGILEKILESNPDADQKQSVLGMIALSAITFGFYIPYWYIKRNRKYNAGNFALVFYIFLFVPAIWLHVYQSSGEHSISKMYSVLLDIITIITGIFLALHLRVQILNENDEIEINPLLTFLFGAFYLQYKMNQIEAEAGQTSG